MAAARMATRGNGRPTVGKVLTGKALLTVGGIFLAMQAALLWWHASEYWSASGAQALSGFSALGMAMVHVVNTVAWNPGAALASALTVLVSCWPLILVVAGIVLLRRAEAGR